MACQPVAAWRTSSTQWYSGLTAATCCSQGGSWFSGKKVPATRNSGVITPVIT